MYKVFVKIILLVLLLTACTSTSPTPVSPPTTPQSPVQTPVAQATEEFVPTPVPAPASGLGAVTGQLIDRETGKVIKGVAVYLADVGDVVMFQQNSSPHVLSDAYGYFALVDVEPKSYAIVLWTPHSSTLVSLEDDDTTLMIEVEADKVTTLGRMEVERP